MPQNFHDKSKEAGNRLKHHILSFSSVATGVFFFTLTGKDVSSFALLEKILLLIAMSFFAITVIISLLELKVDSNRFFQIAKQKEKDACDQNWDKARALKRVRMRLIYSSYVTVTLGFVFTFIYMVFRIA